ncbi:family 10 glycosylhydrolase [Luteolibacter yonseiensis]|uniref:Family 10 glycosylhydrolase n=1 Tax=Luteolibacter yonseiensis TaxID=1144680 RepID=A0A934VC21_9BACT|nr:family 10 glycosylhydrolase [Luteolibacter yonseiensis]MBK1816710.1 family 10 glycosylhydrolase [Luteolibacter yonseiensis]
MVRLITLLTALALGVTASAQSYSPVNERPPAIAREFRGAWIASIYNIDWPSSPGLSAASQQAELRGILDKVSALKMNAVIFQVRPQCDAVYASPIEPWSSSLTGTMGRSPGYDPLAYCIQQAHARGIEVHAWFNPFRALSNNSQQVAGNHISRTLPQITKKFGTMTWCDPASEQTRTRALNVILDVVKRYDIDGVHLDDYFYPYPSGNLRFPDGKSPAERRGYVDGFVSNLYSAVKRQKSWVRVGISPFGIWRPGVPGGIEAGIDSYEQLAGDSRKWLKNGWVDYLAPQLYWPNSPQKQSFSTLLNWWRQQGSRPVWPGIATARIGGPEDRRPASEITNQINLSRQIGQNWNGHIHWSAKSLVRNQGGIATKLAGTYTQPAAIPPMPWISNSAPGSPGVSATVEAGNTLVRCTPDNRTAKLALQAKIGGTWRTMKIYPGSSQTVTIPRADAVAVTALDRFGNASAPKVLGIR